MYSSAARQKNAERFNPVGLRHYRRALLATSRHEYQRRGLIFGRRGAERGGDLAVVFLGSVGLERIEYGRQSYILAIYGLFVISLPWILII